MGTTEGTEPNSILEGLITILLDYGYRSKCCKAAIRVGTKVIKKTNLKTKIWICCACSTRDVDIIPTEEALSKVEHKVL